MSVPDDSPKMGLNALVAALDERYPHWDLYRTYARGSWAVTVRNGNEQMTLHGATIPEAMQAALAWKATPPACPPPLAPWSFRIERDGSRWGIYDATGFVGYQPTKARAKEVIGAICARRALEVDRWRKEHLPESAVSIPTAPQDERETSASLSDDAAEISSASEGSESAEETR